MTTTQDLNLTNCVACILQGGIKIADVVNGKISAMTVERGSVERHPDTGKVVGALKRGSHAHDFMRRLRTAAGEQAYGLLTTGSGRITAVERIAVKQTVPSALTAATS